MQQHAVLRVHPVLRFREDLKHIENRLSTRALLSGRPCRRSTLPLGKRTVATLSGQT